MSARDDLWFTVPVKNVYGASPEGIEAAALRLARETSGHDGDMRVQPGWSLRKTPGLPEDGDRFCSRVVRVNAYRAAPVLLIDPDGPLSGPGHDDLGAAAAAEEDAEDALEIIRGKWLMDGAAALEDAAAQLDEYAAALRQLARDGWTLREPVADDYGFLVPPPGSSDRSEELDDDAAKTRLVCADEDCLHLWDDCWEEVVSSQPGQLSDDDSEPRADAAEQRAAFGELTGNGPDVMPS